ncbi:hypothetical protein [Variovorax fucosicus]|uniref:hypothetical protein n=1 Tax=Variovorax fucosicus TaxID=3053517 RepID=UPI0025780BBC|nr:hypothetical protein [Variovorax sp. J22G47]MDM0058987.1 hypothetical protein [Variovorax sp. J22G47]
MGSIAETTLSEGVAAWAECFAKAGLSTAWRGMLDGGRRPSIRHVRADLRTQQHWSIRDLVIDLQAEVVSQFEAALVKPRTITLHADVIRIPADLRMTLKGCALVMAARRIEIGERAQFSLDHRISKTARLIVFAAEMEGHLDARVIVDATVPEVFRITVPKAAGAMLRAVAGVAAVQEIAMLPAEWFQGPTPAWRLAVSRFQMAAVLMETQPDMAIRLLRHIRCCAKDRPADASFAAEWKELARASRRLTKTEAEGAQVWALDYGRLLFRGAPGLERRRKADELERAHAAMARAVPYELVTNTTPAPEPDHIRYVRHGAVPCGLGLLNADVQPLRSVTLTGAEIVLDYGDRSQFLKLYGGRKDIQTLTIHADTVVIRTGLRFPQTQVTICCRALYFEGADAWIDTTPDPGKVWLGSPMGADGLPGARGGSITLRIERFGTDQAVARHFRAQGGQGQSPRDGGFVLDEAVRYLRPITEADWSALFTVTNRKYAGGTVDPPRWDKYNTDDLVYVELKIGGVLVDKRGEMASPGRGGAGIMAGRPGMGGHGGTVQSTIDDVFAYTDVSGGVSAAALGPSKGHAGGSPTAACWLFFKDVLDGKIRALKARREIKAAGPGPDSEPGPDAFEPLGENGVMKSLPTEDANNAWRTPLNLGVALQFARDALASQRAALAREYLAPYLQDADALLDSDEIAYTQLGRQASDLAEQALRNVDDFGNPPGWVPMLSLESTLSAYLAVVKPSMVELYTAYCIQRAWDGKADRQSTLEKFSDVLTEQTNTTRTALAATRTSVLKLVGEMRQLLLAVEKTSKRLDDVKADIIRKGDARFRSDEGKRVLAASFKILGAIVKAIPLPEPYQAATAGLGVVFDTAGNFVDDDGEAFKKLNDQIADFSKENSESLAAAANSDLADALGRSSREIKDLQTAAAEAKKSSQALARTHDAALQEHAQRAKEERTLYELKKQVLIEGRSTEVRKAVLLKEAETLTGNYEEQVKKRQARLDADTKNLIAVNKKKALLESDIKAKQETEGEQKALLAKQQAASEKSIKAGLMKVQTMVGSVETIKKAVDRLSVPKAQLNSEWDKVVAALKVEDPEFQAITSQMAHLNQMKVDLASRLSRLQLEFTEQKNEIATNLVTIHELSMQMAKAHGVLAPEVAVYAQALGQDAHRDLQQFLYFVVKAYEYQRVEPWGTPQHDAQKLFEDMRNVLVPSDFSYAFVNEADGKARQEQLKELLSGPVVARDGQLTEKEFGLLRVVYEKPLRDMGKHLLRQMQHGGTAKSSKFSITLRASDLQELNDRMARGKEAVIPFDLVRLRLVDGHKERQRITNIQVTQVKCRRTGAELPSTVTFAFTQTGKSLVRADGKIFAFELEGGDQSSPAVSFETSGSRWRGSGTNGVLDEAALTQPNATAEMNLLGQLLEGERDAPAPQRIKLSEVQPGALSEFLLAVYIKKPEMTIALDEVELTVTTEGTDAPSDEWMVCITADVPGMVPFKVNKPDRAGHHGGLGRYMAVFKRTDESVEVSVGSTFGGLTHRGWIVDGKPVEGTPTSTITLSKSSFLVARYASD